MFKQANDLIPQLCEKNTHENISLAYNLSELGSSQLALLVNLDLALPTT
jgi:hypothetical protein